MTKYEDLEKDIPYKVTHDSADRTFKTGDVIVRRSYGLDNMGAGGTLLYEEAKAVCEDEGLFCEKMTDPPESA